jgi:hypothetical protein
MREKRLLLSIVVSLFAVFLAVNLSASVSAAVNGTSRVDLAYTWLSGKVSPWPAGDDGAFALMALSYDGILGQKGKDALIASSKNNGECWPSSGCNVKSTALAIIALNMIGYDTLKAENWLVSKKQSYVDTLSQWNLQIDSSDTNFCTIEYDDRRFSINISSDKKISSSIPIPCLPQSQYGFKISSSCLSKRFLIKCDSDFFVSMIYTKGNVLYIPGNTKTGTGGSYVEASIETVCLANVGSCDYEATEWAVYALTQKGRDVSMFVPYLIGFSTDNKYKIPDAFLYVATSDSAYADALLTSQHPNGYWFISADKVYDTAIVGLSLKDYNADAKTNAENYLLTAQSGDGSWGTIGKTGLVLYTFWPKSIAPPIVPGINECEQRGYICRTSCDVGEEVKSDYDIACSPQKCCGSRTEITCSSEGYKCCSKCAYDLGHQTDLDGTCSYGDLCCSQCETEQSCSDLGGMICDVGESCTTTPEVTPDGDCCLGSCEKAEKTCAELGGVPCESSKCSGQPEMASDVNCCIGGECKGTNLTWLYIIIGAAVAAVIIFFLNKKGIIKFGRKGKPPAPSTFVPSQPARPAVSSRPAVRPIMPWPGAQQPVQRPQPQPAAQQAPRAKKPDEFEETFKKLKEMQ